MEAFGPKIPKYLMYEVEHSAGVPREGQIGPISLFSSQIKKSQDLSSSPGRVMNSIDEDD